jgi:hypothetical protein
MCGGPRSYNPLRVVYDETIVERTTRLLRENGVSDIAISTLDERYEKFGLPILKHDNSLSWSDFYWLKAFYPAKEPVCYIFGDVFFSPEAIKTIVETKTDDIEFFASAPPYSEQYTKKWAEPYAFKVQNVDRFFKCIDRVIQLDRWQQFQRPCCPISWELWQVIKKTPLNHIDYTNYTAINDYTVDIDSDEHCQLIRDRGYGK